MERFLVVFHIHEKNSGVLVGSATTFTEIKDSSETSNKKEMIAKKDPELFAHLGDWAVKQVSSYNRDNYTVIVHDVIAI
ncbi:MAG: hypothetical protein JNN15_18650 [Blastocatellia bacterium]|nr:hypothetical protein [Blastocatellia bacterium]